jgi:metal-dependent amidase/aminoacylase/carboxypeptidase family protein
MHACGHDAHTATVLTVARLLAAEKEELAGTVMFMFQPAEEGLGGAGRMIDDGLLDDPKPDLPWRCMCGAISKPAKSPPKWGR